MDILTATNKSNINRQIYVLIFILLFLIPTINAQDLETNQEVRTTIEVGYKLSDQLKLTLSPEFRFDEEQSLDEYLIEGGADYQISDLLSLGASYRMYTNLRDNKDDEIFTRIAFSGTLSKNYNRFEPAMRIMYNKYSGDNIEDESFMRFKASLKYDIPNSELKPVVGVEAFQQLSDSDLYKMRYTAGLNYKLFKNNYLGINYKLDLFSSENKNNHIVGLAYKLKL